jgi:hypothetical protein
MGYILPMALFWLLTEAAMPSRYQMAGLLVWLVMMMDKSGCYVLKQYMTFQSHLLGKQRDLSIVNQTNSFGI